MGMTQEGTNTGGWGGPRGGRNAAGPRDVSWEHLAGIDDSAQAWVYQEKNPVIVQQILAGIYCVPGGIPGYECAELKE